MSPPSRTESTCTDPRESGIRRLVDEGDLEAAASLFMETYGGEILGFLHLWLRNQIEAQEVFSEFTEDFWRGLPSFLWKTSIRSWGYTLARNAACRSRRASRRRSVPLTHPSRMLEPANRAHTRTPQYLRTEVKHRMRELRAQLPIDDQSLLVLRIDKGLSWKELAVIYSGKGEMLSEADTKRWAARLRQRFVTIKEQLRELAEAEGLI